MIRKRGFRARAERHRLAASPLLSVPAAAACGAELVVSGPDGRADRRRDMRALAGTPGSLELAFGSRGPVPAIRPSMAGSIGIALGSAGPTVSIVPTLAAVVAASSFASPIAILICGGPCWPSLGRFVGSTAVGGRQASTASVVRY